MSLSCWLKEVREHRGTHPDPAPFRKDDGFPRGKCLGLQTEWLKACVPGANKIIIFNYGAYFWGCSPSWSLRVARACCCPVFSSPS